MVALTLSNSNHKILIIGPIYDKIDKLQRAISLKDNYDLLIFNGNLCYPNDDLNLVKDRIRLMDQHLQTGKIIYNIGQFDLQLMNKLEDNNPLKEWIKERPNVILINFQNQTSLIITGGGLTPKIVKKDLYDNLELTFVSYIQNESWHKLYGGNLGYVISNNPLTKKEPQFYNYSAQIGNFYDKEVQVYAQEADQFGLKKTILL